MSLPVQAHWAGQNCLLILEKSEELLSSLKQFAERNNITSAFFYGLGGTDRVKIGVYNESLGSYLYTEYKIHMEISSLTGNIFQHEGKPFVHVHGVFSASGGMSFGGHIAECDVSPVCEIHLTKLPDVKVARKGPLPFPRIANG